MAGFESRSPGPLDLESDTLVIVRLMYAFVFAFVKSNHTMNSMIL